MYTSLFNSLTPTDTIITVNRRLAAFLKEQFSNHQQNKNQTVWESPDILPFTSWIERCWLQSQTRGIGKPLLLLNLAQEQILWQQIISESNTGKDLLQTFATAQIAKQAWELTRQWQLNFHFPKIFQTEDTVAWQGWAEKFQQRCKKNHWLDRATLVDYVIALVVENTFDHLHSSPYKAEAEFPQRFFLVGFDELNPQYQKLFKALKTHGCEYHVVQQENHEAKINSIACADSETELLTMARWAHHLHQSNKEHIDLQINKLAKTSEAVFNAPHPIPPPHKLGEGELVVETRNTTNSEATYGHNNYLKHYTIGCIIPNLTEVRWQVIDTFSKVFAPESILPGYYDTPLPFNVSSGSRLKNFSLIHTALLALTLSEFVSLESISALLRSPYIGFSEKEMSTRAKLDFILRKRGEKKILLQEVITLAKKNDCSAFANYLQKFIKIKLVNKKYFPSEWATFFSEQLNSLSWPGERVLNSFEYQLYERWIKLLNEFVSLGLITEKISHEHALKHLNELAGATIFQPKTKHSTSIQILGTLEAAGLAFDHLWVMGLHDTAWPASTHPNPFIPKELQREFKMPHASSERELEFSKKITARLIQSAPNIILSYPEREEDRVLRPSKLIEAVVFNSPPPQPSPIKGEGDFLMLPPFQSYAEIIFNSARLESYEDFTAPLLTQEEKIFGGTAIFKHQAACPFRAFARIRLGAQRWESPQIGLSAMERGSLLHNALEAFWNLMESQEKLLACDDNELTKTIQQAIDSALLIATKARPLTFKNQLTQIEKKRLSLLLQNWIEEEKERPTFTVLATEKNQEYTIANIPLKLRVDRIDQLSDGSCYVIDYKTGLTSINTWFGERPDEPQLPLYCVTNELPIRGLLFAQLRANKSQFKGVTENESNIPGVTALGELKDISMSSDWKKLQNTWKETLENLAKQFQNGDATVDPKYGEQTCRTCDLQLLCRIREK